MVTSLNGVKMSCAGLSTVMLFSLVIAPYTGSSSECISKWKGWQVTGSAMLRSVSRRKMLLQVMQTAEVQIEQNFNFPRCLFSEPNLWIFTDTGNKRSLSPAGP